MASVALVASVAAYQPPFSSLAAISLARNPYGERFYRPFSPPLDQNQPGGGYTPENTRLVCVAVNIALNRFGEEVFHRVCEGFLRRHQDGRPKRDAVEPEGVAEPD